MNDDRVSPDEVERVQLLEQVQLGIDIEQLVGHRIGAYLLDKIKTERQDALDALAEVDPEDPKAIRALQFKVQVVDRIEGWLADAVTEARNAEHTLKSLDRSD